ncbi:hypothetical protein [Nocardioides nanhaiensis]|uniref:ANTAR domain-containing protein n=1 Tax=Nocardioides nanhaiensis TaxID=1476871 RepID=A0ABP8W832_9ACTN
MDAQRDEVERLRARVLELEERLGVEKARASLRADRLRMARELNDTIVQALVAAEMAMDLDRPEQARSLVGEASRHSREMIGQLVGERLLPGTALRHAPERAPWTLDDPAPRRTASRIAGGDAALDQHTSPEETRR